MAASLVLQKKWEAYCLEDTEGLPAVLTGASLVSDCSEIGICLRMVKRWCKACLGDGGGHDRRKGSRRLVLHTPSEEERQRILPPCN